MTLSEVLSLINFSDIDRDIKENPNPILIQGAVEAAQSGDLNTLTYIAKMYALGTPFVKSDKNKAFWICSYCAENNYADAYLLLGDMYELGYGVQKSFSKALDCWHDGAEKGSAICMYKYAGKNKDRRVYENGGRLTPFEENAWFKKSADCGYAPACVTIGLAHIRGEYAIPDCKLGVEYLRKAYNMGDTSFMNFLDDEIQKLYHKGINADEQSVKDLALLTMFRDEIKKK